jgi:hypothetical protein
MNVIKTLVSGLALSLFLPLAAEAEIEPATGILGFASASYSCSKAPRVDEGGPGFALFQIPSQAPYRALAYAAAQSRGIERLGMVVAVSDFCYAGSYSGQIPGLG